MERAIPLLRQQLTQRHCLKGHFQMLPDKGDTETRQAWKTWEKSDNIWLAFKWLIRMMSPKICCFWSASLWGGAAPHSMTCLQFQACLLSQKGGVKKPKQIKVYKGQAAHIHALQLCGLGMEKGVRSSCHLGTPLLWWYQKKQVPHFLEIFSSPRQSRHFKYSCFVGICLSHNGNIWILLSWQRPSGFSTQFKELVVDFHLN